MSTWTTRGRRRAITNPASVTNPVSANVHCADGATSDAYCCADSNPRAASNSRSRSKVRTNSEEKKPMDKSPTQARRSASLGLRIERFRTDSGITTQHAINIATPAHTPNGPIDNAGSSRQATYPGSARISHTGFKSTRRTVTRWTWGRHADSSRPLALNGLAGNLEWAQLTGTASRAHGFAHGFHSLELDELGSGRPQIITVQEGLE